jgi:hypothetical protein
MSQQDSVQLSSGQSRAVPVLAMRLPAALEQAAVHENARMLRLDMVRGSGHITNRAVEINVHTVL